MYLCSEKYDRKAYLRAPLSVVMYALFRVVLTIRKTLRSPSESGYQDSSRVELKPFLSEARRPTR